MSACRKLKIAFDRPASWKNRKNKYDTAIQLFESNKSRYSHPLHFAAENDYGNLIRHILGFGCDINILDKNGHTPLQVAINSVSPNSVKVLIEWGCSIDNIVIKALCIEKFIERDHIVAMELLATQKIINPTNFHIDHIYWPFIRISENMLTLIVTMGFFKIHSLTSYDISYIITSYIRKMIKHNRYDERVAILMAAGIEPASIERYTIDDNATAQVDGNLKTKLRGLIRDGVSAEYKQEFNEKCEYIRWRLDKRNASLFDLLWRQLSL